MLQRSFQSAAGQRKRCSARDTHPGKDQLDRQQPQRCQQQPVQRRTRMQSEYGYLFFHCASSSHACSMRRSASSLEIPSCRSVRAMVRLPPQRIQYIRRQRHAAFCACTRFHQMLFLQNVKRFLHRIRVDAEQHRQNPARRQLVAVPDRPGDRATLDKVDNLQIHRRPIHCAERLKRHHIRHHRITQVIHSLTVLYT